MERGLAERILFAVSSRLRVSEELLEEGSLGALYVYKGAMRPRAVSRVERLATVNPSPAKSAKSSRNAAARHPKLSDFRFAANRVNRRDRKNTDTVAACGVAGKTLRWKRSAYQPSPYRLKYSV